MPKGKRDDRSARFYWQPGEMFVLEADTPEKQEELFEEEVNEFLETATEEELEKD